MAKRTCEVDGCDRKHNAKGLCAVHFRSSKICSIPECEEPVVARGWCGTHYQRWSKYGDPLTVKPNPGNRTVRPVPATRTCRTCGLVGDAVQFRPKTNLCKKCSAAYKAQWARDNPEKMRAIIERAAPVRARYELRRRAIRNGQDPDLIEAYYTAHAGRCEICGGPPGRRDLHIDHDHVTGRFRGLLCDSCNNGLGRFKDDIGNLEAAIRYLRRAGSDPTKLFAI